MCEAEATMFQAVRGLNHYALTILSILRQLLIQYVFSSYYFFLLFFFFTVNKYQSSYIIYVF